MADTTVADKEFGTDGQSASTPPAVNGHEASRQMTHEEREVAQAAARFGYGPLAQVTSKENRLPAFGGEFQPGLYRPIDHRKFANPAPLGLCAFALTTFVLSLINFQTEGVTNGSLVLAIAFGYGGLVQLLAGMWEMAVGNTFGATALSSYGGFWISYAIINTPGGFEIVTTLEKEGGASAVNNSLAFYLYGWFIFTTILLICTLKSTVAFFSLFFTLDIAFLLLALGHTYFDPESGSADAPLTKAGGMFGLLAAFLAWYNALAGIADNSNSFFIAPVVHFPWSEKGMAARQKTERETV